MTPKVHSPLPTMVWNICVNYIAMLMFQAKILTFIPILMVTIKPIQILMPLLMLTVTLPVSDNSY